MKHRIKLFLRELYARLLFHTGLHQLVDRLMPPRLTILAGHCVAPPDGKSWPGGEHLPADMKISAERLEGIVEWLAGRYRMVTIGQGVEELSNGAPRSLVALSMDDGYRDNHRFLLPILERRRLGATIFLESRPLDERRVNWSHKLFWILARTKPFDFVHRYGELAPEDPAFHAANQVVTEARVADPVYHVKRILKYDADPALRDPAIDAIFTELGGDERALCDTLYMDWDEARELQEKGFELGGHTAGHPILSRLPPEEAEREIAAGRASLERALGRAPVTFAYPWGRRWDFDERSAAAVHRAGFRTAVTMHAGTNLRSTDPSRHHRVAIDDRSRLHLIAAEACGGFELARRLGMNLSE